jgi:addiction module RelE/StbE family toxin
MVFKIKFSEQAADDLNDIINYICDVLINPIAAERFFNELDEKLESICEFPRMFPLHQNERLNAMNVRFAVVGSYLLFYLIDDSQAVVNILRILYGKRDIPFLI